MRTIAILGGALLLFLSLYHLPCSGVQIQFPPDQGTYTGDYVLIQEPGRYTLEENISHSYPVGVIITSSSVILDGQGNQISPALRGGPSVGIWITREDKAGNPVTGVKIQNCTIANEVAGIYIEGSDSSEFPWGSRVSEVNSLDNTIEREDKISDVKITGCKNGVAVYDLLYPIIWQSELRDNEKGLIIKEGSPDIKNLVVTGNSLSGITLQKTTGGELSGCRLEGNTEAGIILDNVSGIQIWNNILDNSENINTIDSTGIALNSTLKNQTNIIQGSFTGGNLWSNDGIPVYISNQISDENQDGIGDSSYLPETGLEDYHPLIPSGTGFSLVQSPTLQIQTVTTVVPAPTPLSIITGIHAIIAGDTIPTTMKTDTKYQVDLTILNDGSDDWLETHAVGIRASGDAAVWGPEWMPAPVVPSKQSYTFNYTIQSPKEPGTYELSYQAIRSGQGVSITFGRPYKKVVTVM